MNCTEGKLIEHTKVEYVGKFSHPQFQFLSKKGTVVHSEVTDQGSHVMTIFIRLPNTHLPKAFSIRTFPPSSKFYRLYWVTARTGLDDCRNSYDRQILVVVFLVGFFVVVDFLFFFYPAQSVWRREVCGLQSCFFLLCWVAK